MIENEKIFTASVAEELKTPLAAIMSNADMIVNYVENIVDAKLLAKNIYSEAERLALMTKNLFTLTRLETAGQGELQFKEVDLSLIIREAVALCRIRSTEKQQTIHCKFDDNCIISCEPDLLRQVFVNLVDNATKYSPPESTIVIDMTGDADFVNISVADNGTGISAPDRERIFEMFYRADKARTQTIAGTGLGLAITKQIVGTLHGEIRVDSIVGTGTIFTVKLPK